MDSKKITSTYHRNVYDNFLIHWKYVKREKVNGKWKYYYKTDEEREHDAKEAVQETLGNFVAAIKPKTENKERSQNPNAKVVKGSIIDKVKDMLGYDEKADYEKQEAKLEKARAVTAKSKERLDKAQNKYSEATSELEQKKSDLDAAMKNEKRAEKAYVEKRGAESDQQKKKNLENAMDARKDAEKEYETAKHKADMAAKALNQTDSAYAEFTARTQHVYNDYELAKSAYETTFAFKVSELSDKFQKKIDNGRNSVVDLLNKLDKNKRRVS